jgi:hypothetical protein
VTVTVNKIPTTLTAIVSPTTVNVTQNFTVAGRLTNGTAGFSNQTITEWRSTDNATWPNIRPPTTNSTGWYAFIGNKVGCNHVLLPRHGCR